MAMGSDPKQIRSIARAVTVLQAINRHGSLTMTQISQEVGLSYATTSRIVRTLINEGLIEQEPSRKSYRPTILVLSLSCGYFPRSRLVAEARPHIEKLTRTTGWPVSITSRVGPHMVLQDSTHSLTTQTFSDYLPGFPMPLVRSAAGLAFLAALPAQDRSILLKQISGLDDDTDWNARMIKQRGDSFFDDINERGYAVYLKSQDTKNPGKTSSLAVPLYYNDEVVASLTLIFFASAMSAHEAYENYGESIRAAQSGIHGALSETEILTAQ